MATIPFLNPSPFLPQMRAAPGPVRAGLEYSRQADDYRTLIEAAKVLQNLGVQQAQAEFSEWQRNAPLRQLETQARMATLEGQLPYLANVASSAAQQAIARSQYETQTQYSKEAIDEYFRKMRQGVTDDQWQNMQRDLEYGANVANTAIQLAQAQGVPAAMAYIESQKRQAEQLGRTLPPSIDNPNAWGAIVQAATWSLPHMRALEVEKLKNQGALERTKVQAQATIKAAEIGAASRGADSNRPLSASQEAATIRREIDQRRREGKDIPPSLMNRYRAAVDGEWNDFVQNRPDLQILLVRSTQPGPDGQAATRQFNEYYRQFMKARGFEEKVSSEAPEAAGGRASGKPTTSGWTARQIK